MVETIALHAKAVELSKHVIRMTTAAGSGHPSSGQALAHLVTELMYRRMRYDPADPWNPAGDRLVLSIGHAVPIVYAAYADLQGTVGTTPEKGVKLTVDDLSTLRQLDSVLDGHPNPAEGFPFFDAATGSLGQGLSVGAGLALAARLDHSPRRVFVIVGDGEAREGQVAEALDFIADHQLTNLCALISCNGHGQAGPVSTQQSAAVMAQKLAAYGWEVVDVDGHDPEQISRALDRFGTVSRPLAVVARTVKGWGVDLMAGVNFHGKPVPPDQVEKACAQLDATGKKLGVTGPADLGRPPKPAAFKPKPAPGGAIKLPPLEQTLERVELSAALSKKKLSTRVAYGVALVALGDVDQRVVALDGDVSNSTFANLFAAKHPDRFFECKIAEQNMITTAAGLAAAGKIPFASSFAKFIARAYDQVDMAVISRANVKIMGSHSGVSLGADGPSQMAVSDLAYFRSFTRVESGRQGPGGRGGPACRIFHPADAVCAYRCAELMANLDGMCYLRTHRSDAPFVYPLDEKFELGGCKRLRTGDQLTLVSSGFMLHTVLAAAERLAADGIGCNVFDAYTFPADATPILEAARGAGGTILTVEDNYTGGLDAELALAAAAEPGVQVVGMTANRIPKSALTAEEVFGYVGVDTEHIIGRVRTLL